jgi:hypothetical protein
MEVTIESAFECGSSVFEFSPETGEFKKLASVAPATWHDDPIQTQAADIARLGAVLYSHRQHGHSVDLVGHWSNVNVPPNMVLYSWDQNTEGWSSVEKISDWVLGKLTRMISVAEAADEFGVIELVDGWCIPLSCDEFLVSPRDGRWSISSGPYNSPLYIDLERGCITCDKWEEEDEKRQLLRELDDFEQQITVFLKRGGPRSLEAAKKKFAYASLAVVYVAEKLFPITCGGKAPQRAP